MWKTTILITAVFLASCGGGDEGWVCKINGGNMYSIGPSGNLGSADKARM